jgi:hypothetical protein
VLGRNPDEHQEAAAEFIRIMKRLQVEFDDVSNKFAVFQACAARASGPLHAEQTTPIVSSKIGLKTSRPV